MADESSVVISRADAVARGMKFYFTGKPCKNGHVSVRRAAGGHCLICGRLQSNASTKAWVQKNLERAREASRIRARKRRELPETKEREREWRRDNADKCRFYTQTWRGNNADLVRERAAKFREENRAKLNAAARDRRQNCPEAVRTSIRKWQAANLDKHAANQRNRRARSLKADGKHSSSDIGRILISQRGKCANCRSALSGKFHVDHIMPLALGGSNWPRNLQLLCQTCNQRKHAKHPIDFARECGRLL